MRTANITMECVDQCDRTGVLYGSDDTIDRLLASNNRVLRLCPLLQPLFRAAGEGLVWRPAPQSDSWEGYLNMRQER